MSFTDNLTTLQRIIKSGLTTDLAMSAMTIGAMAPLFNAFSNISNHCIAANLTARKAYTHITHTEHGHWSFLHGAGKSTLQQIIKSGARNVVWFKKTELDDAFPQASNYMIPAYFAASEVLLNPITVALTRNYECTPYPTTLKPWFAGALPGCLKLSATSAIYMRVKPPIDNLMENYGINPNSAFGGALSAPLIATPITLLTQPFERMKRTLQFATNERLSFFGVTRSLATTMNTHMQREGLAPALRFIIRGWAPALISNTVYTIAFNLMILSGADSTPPPHSITFHVTITHQA